MSSAPTGLSIVMLSLNEAHNMAAVLENIGDLAEAVYLLDSYSRDETVDIALANGVHVVQRRFRNFGDQWNYAVSQLPIETPWTMKLDPDERLNVDLKASIRAALVAAKPEEPAGFEIERRLWFMGQPMPVHQTMLRIWRTGQCRFTDAAVNEHPIVEGRIAMLAGQMEHHDSPSLHHWIDKQNRYSTTQAVARYEGVALSVQPRLMGSRIERSAWFREAFWRLPGRFKLLYLWLLIGLGAWRAGRPGWIWARMRVERYRLEHDKLYEMRMHGEVPPLPPPALGGPDPRVPNADR